MQKTSASEIPLTKLSNQDFRQLTEETLDKNLPYFVSPRLQFYSYREKCYVNFVPPCIICASFPLSYILVLLVWLLNVSLID